MSAPDLGLSENCQKNMEKHEIVYMKQLGENPFRYL